VGFIHPKSEVDSRAVLGRNVYVAAFAAIRADEGKVEIKDNVNIQETCVIHGENVIIGNNVTLGHGAIVHGCKIAGNVLVGMNATILSGCEIGEWSIVAAGAVVLENSRIPPSSIVAGVPAKIIRQANESDRKLISSSCENYISKLQEMGKCD